jgi:hypothetical protein
MRSPTIVAVIGTVLLLLLAAACSSPSSNGNGDAATQSGNEAGDDAVSDQRSNGDIGVLPGEAGPGDGSLPAIDPNTSLASLTPADQARLCDWMNITVGGGYGVVTNCGGGNTVQNSASQTQCIMVALQFRCTVTVGQLENCVRAQAPSHGCVRGQPECKPLLC